MSNNPGSFNNDIKWKSDNIPYHYYEFRELILYAYWQWIDLKSVTSKFGDSAYPSDVGEWLKTHKADLIAGHTWRLPSEEVKLLFILRWS